MNNEPPSLMLFEVNEMGNKESTWSGLRVSLCVTGEGHGTPDITPDTLEERSEFTLLGSKQYNKRDIKNVMWKLEVDVYQHQSRGGHFNSHPKPCMIKT